MNSSSTRLGPEFHCMAKCAQNQKAYVPMPTARMRRRSRKWVARRRNQRPKNDSMATKAGVAAPVILMENALAHVTPTTTHHARRAGMDSVRLAARGVSAPSSVFQRGRKSARLPSTAALDPARSAPAPTASASSAA